MTFEKQERELRLKDLVFGVLRRWRSVLVLALVCGLALGGFAFLKNRNANPQTADRTAYLQELERYQQQYTAKEYEVQWLSNRVEQYRTYMKQSVMMGIDPTAVCRAEVDIYIVGSDEELARRMLDDYRAALSDGAFVQSAAQTMGIESKYLWELITVSVKETVIGESTQRYINVVIDHSTLEGANQLLNLVADRIHGVEPAVQEALGTHTLELAVQEASIRVDTSNLAGRQWLEQERMSEYERTLASAEKALAALTPPAEPANPQAAGGNVVKLAVVGALLGGVLGCGWGVLAILFGDKLYSVSDLQGRYRVKILGSVAGKGKRCAIDKLLDRLEGRRSKDTPDNDALVAAITEKQLDGGAGLLVGDGNRIADLAKRLGMTLTAQRLTDSEGLKQLECCDGVIVLCVCGKDRYSQMEKTMEMVENLGKKVYGCIVAEY